MEVRIIERNLQEVEADHHLQSHVRTSSLNCEPVLLVGEGQAQFNELINPIIRQPIHGMNSRISMGPAILDVFVGLYVSEAELIAENLFYSHHQLFML